MDRNTTGCPMLKNSAVALRKESVDRNVVGDVMGKGLAVALRKESVDRNRNTLNKLINVHSRSPQGERG